MPKDVLKKRPPAIVSMVWLTAQVEPVSLYYVSRFWSSDPKYLYVNKQKLDDSGFFTVDNEGRYFANFDKWFDLSDPDIQSLYTPDKPLWLSIFENVQFRKAVLSPDLFSELIRTEVRDILKLEGIIEVKAYILYALALFYSVKTMIVSKKYDVTKALDEVLAIQEAMAVIKPLKYRFDVYAKGFLTKERYETLDKILPHSKILYESKIGEDIRRMIKEQQKLWQLKKLI